MLVLATEAEKTRAENREGSTNDHFGHDWAAYGDPTFLLPLGLEEKCDFLIL